MNPPSVECWQPTPTIRDDIVEHAASLARSVANITQSAIIQGTAGTNVREVPTLAWFFVYGLPLLESEWNRILKSTSVKFKGVFCHYDFSSSSGPLVTHPDLKHRRELADILLLVSCDGTPVSAPAANGVFLQTKAGRSLTGPSTKEQRILYEELDDFSFTDSVVDSTALDTPPPASPRLRSMPVARERGFKFWFLRGKTWATSHPLYVWPYTPASTTAEYPFIARPHFDQLFPTTFLRVVLGLDGLGISQLQPGHYGWNRIIRDTLIQSLHKAVGAKSVAPSDRITPNLSADDLLKLVVDDDLTVLRNPFDELARLLNDQEVADFFKKLQRRASRYSNPPKPPRIDRKGRGDQDGGPATIIWVKLSDKGKGRDESSPDPSSTDAPAPEGSAKGTGAGEQMDLPSIDLKLDASEF